MNRAITLEKARGLWRHLSSEHHVQVTDYWASAYIEDFAHIAEFLGVEDFCKFMNHNSLSFVDSIYCPFSPGSPAEGWTPLEQCRVAVHEHHHILQAESVGALAWGIGYLFDSGRRAYFEAEALRVEMELMQWAIGSTPDVDELADVVLRYGCDVHERDCVRSYLVEALPMVRRGKVISAVSESAISWLEQAHDDLPS